MDQREEDKIPSATTTNNENTNFEQKHTNFFASDLLNRRSNLGLSEQFGSSNSTTLETNYSSYSLSEILNNLCKEDTVNAGQEVEDNPEWEPFVKIIEEPASNLYRFRYGSEGETAGSIPGEKQQYGRKTFPKIILKNYEGQALLEVCCLTEDLKVHPNKLVRTLTKSNLLSKFGYFQVWRKAKVFKEEEVQAGIYRTKIIGNRIEEVMLGVNMSKKSDVQNLLTSKQELGVDPFYQGYSHAEGKARKQLDLTQVFLLGIVGMRPGDHCLQFTAKLSTTT